MRTSRDLRRRHGHQRAGLAQILDHLIQRLTLGTGLEERSRMVCVLDMPMVGTLGLAQRLVDQLREDVVLYHSNLLWYSCNTIIRFLYGHGDWEHHGSTS
jgi:hypothetical protein